jgi:hypothetical protein
MTLALNKKVVPEPKQLIGKLMDPRAVGNFTRSFAILDNRRGEKLVRKKLIIITFRIVKLTKSLILVFAKLFFLYFL